MRKLAPISFALVLIAACSPVKYFAAYEGGHDPSYNIKKAKTIGFTPICWTAKARNLGYDAHIEKQMFAYARDELQNRGYTVYYIPPEFIEEDTVTNAIYVKDNFKNMPDLTLTIRYWQGPGTTSQPYLLLLGFTLWSGAPKFLNKAWEGTIKKGSPKLDLFDQAQNLTTEIFSKKFDQ